MSLTYIKKILYHIQLRLDFNTFTIAGPSTATSTVAKMAGGSISPTGALAVTTATQCLTDTFTMTGIPGGVPPTICGTNTGYHGNLGLRFHTFYINLAPIFKIYNCNCKCNI